MDAKSLLSAAGWPRQDPAEVAAIERAWRSEGFTGHEAGLAFVSEFSGLTVWSADRGQCLSFDPVQALRDTDPTWCHSYAADSGRSLLPIGSYSHLVLMVDEEGVLWGGFDAEYGTLANTVIELVQVLLVEPGSRHLEKTLSDYE